MRKAIIVLGVFMLGLYVVMYIYQSLQGAARMMQQHLP